MSLEPALAHGAKAKPKARSPRLANSAPPAFFYRSSSVSAGASGVGTVKVDLSLRAGSLETGTLRKLVGGVIRAKAKGKAKERVEVDATKLANAVRESLKQAAAEVFRSRFESEIDKVVDAYRALIHENLATGEDAALRHALNRARLQERILAGTPMVNQAEACQLLGLSATNPSATMKRREESRELLRFSVDGRAAYPLFQFDVEERRIQPLLGRLIARKPEGWSSFRLLHWLTRPHLDFDDTPALGIGRRDDDILAAFDREIAPVAHG